MILDSAHNDESERDETGNYEGNTRALEQMGSAATPISHESFCSPKIGPRIA